MKRELQMVLISLSALGTMAHSGCVVAAVGGATAGSVAYVRGDLEYNLAANIADSQAAAVAAIQEMDFVLISNNVDAASGEIIARTAADKKVSIKLERLTSNATKISIRVGTFGDEELSQTLLDLMRHNLIEPRRA